MSMSYKQQPTIALLRIQPRGKIGRVCDGMVFWDVDGLAIMLLSLMMRCGDNARNCAPFSLASASLVFLSIHALFMRR